MGCANACPACVGKCDADLLLDGSDGALVQLPQFALFPILSSNQASAPDRLLTLTDCLSVFPHGCKESRPEDEKTAFID